MPGVAIIIVLILIVRFIKRRKKKRNNKNAAISAQQSNSLHPESGSIDQYIEQGQKIQALKQEYMGIIDRHLMLEEKIGVMYTVARELHLPNSPEMEQVVELCKEDILLAKDILDYYRKWDAISGIDNGNSLRFDTFKRLAIIYEKQGRYDEAIEVCQQAVSLGITKDGTDGGMLGRAARLTRKKLGRAKKVNAPTEKSE